MDTIDRKREHLRSMRILAISGSLRLVSSNTALLHAATRLAPEDVEIGVYGGLADLPHFNPDLDGDATPPPVTEFRCRLRAADGVLISSPEYAHGVPGVLKNALDWVVASGEFADMPVALINASPRATHAQASLTETLTVMAASLVAEASISVPLLGKTLDAAGIASDPEISGALRSAIAAFARAIDARRSSLHCLAREFRLANSGRQPGRIGNAARSRMLPRGQHMKFRH